jgi:glutamyl-tRNA synthetase
MPVSGELKEAIRKYAIKNAIDFGTADPGSVIGKVIPIAKGTPISDIKTEVQGIVAAVNGMKKEALENAYEPFKIEFEKKAEEVAAKTAKPKMVLDGAVVGNFATRWPPEPSGYQHLGHAKPMFLEDEFRRLYNGKMFLYFDDTNPEKASQEFVDADRADLKWLGIEFDAEYYASDNIDKIYEYARQLIRAGNAYVCKCDQETAKEKRRSMEECEHRSATPEDNLSEFEKMVGGKYDESAAVLRFKGDMKSQNTVMRDPTIARIKKDKHYRQGTKYSVWPTYDLAAPIMDSMKGVTDVLRSKEYELRDELNKKILGLLGLRVPRIHEFARLNVKGNTTHKREIRKLISDGVINGWDDPRLMTLIAIKRRGILPQAIREFALRFGMSKTDSVLPLDALLAENRKIIDPIASHLFFVGKPIKLVVKGAENMDVKLRLHPEKDFGFREYKTTTEFYISGDDAAGIKVGSIVRLKDLIDVEIKSKNEIIEATKVNTPGSNIIQWVPAKDSVKSSVLIAGNLMDDDGNLNEDSLSVLEGYAEAYSAKLKEHDIVQFERFGYCILDKKDGPSLQFIFISK